MPELTKVNLDSLQNGPQHEGMTARAPVPQSPITLDIDHYDVALPERFTIRILGPSARTVDGKAVGIIGRRLIVQVAESVPAGEAVRINAPDSFLLGEVLGCWRQPGAIFAAVELQQALTRLSELARWMDEPGRMDLRLSA